MANLQSNKLPVSNVAGVNDNPLVDANQGINGTKMILSFNSLVDAVEADLINLTTTINNLPGGGNGNSRELLTENRIYYFSTTGNDTNNGLTALTPIKTLNHFFLNILPNIDLGIYDCICRFANGTYTENWINCSGIIASSSFNDNITFQTGKLIIESESGNKNDVTINANWWIDLNVSGIFRIRNVTLKPIENWHTFDVFSKNVNIVFQNVLFDHSSKPGFIAINAIGGTIKINNENGLDGTNNQCFFKGSFESAVQISGDTLLFTYGTITLDTVTITGDGFIVGRLNSTLILNSGGGGTNLTTGNELALERTTVCLETLFQLPGTMGKKYIEHNVNEQEVVPLTNRHYVGFFGNTPIAKQSLSSSATLPQLLTVLANYGLINIV